MKKLGGLYRINTPHIIQDKHGGGTITQEVYWFVAFYEKEHLVGLYGSSKEDYESFVSKQFELHGTYTLTDQNQLTFIIENPYTQEILQFEGMVINEEQKIKLKGVKKTTPEENWIDDDFIKVTIDHIA